MPLRFQFDDFEIDEARFEIRRAGEVVHVQPKVLDLVLHLVRHRERVVTKEELLETVWRGVAVTESSLIQAISLARRALDDTPTEQRVIRTVRNRGFQLVVAPRAATRAPAEVRHVEPAASTGMETEEDRAARSVEVLASSAARVPRLFAVLDCEAPFIGASWSLADLDEVIVVRGSEHRSKRHTSSLSRVLTLTVPGRFMSRQHARIVRTPAEWLVTDETSRNGTFVNGERIDRRRSLCDGDVVECGRMLYRFCAEPQIPNLGPDFEIRRDASPLFPTVTPRHAALARDLAQVAASSTSILLSGESGVGKTHVAGRLHHFSSRQGPLVVLEGSATLDAGAFERARDGTVLVENVERVPPAALHALTSALGGHSAPRVITTTTLPIPELANRVPSDALARLSGFRCTLPPLRDRSGDLGVLIAALAEARSRAVSAFDIAAGRALVGHAWPGNLHELSHVLEVADVLGRGGTIERDHLPVELRGADRK